MNIELHTQTMDLLMDYCRKYDKQPHRVCNELLDTYMSEFVEVKTNDGGNNEKNNKHY